jgi:glutamyl-tRNA synthetase
VQVAQAVLAAYDSGELQQAVEGADDAYKGWVKALGKAQKRKGKRLFMPLRLALTGSTHVRNTFFLISRCTGSS